MNSTNPGLAVDIPPMTPATEPLSPMRLVVMASGTGSTFIAIHRAIQEKILNAEIACLVSNNADCGAVAYARENNVNHVVLEWNAENLTRPQYDTVLSNEVHQHPHDLIVLAGWMHVLGKSFTSVFKNTINLFLEASPVWIAFKKHTTRSKLAVLRKPEAWSIM